MWPWVSRSSSLLQNPHVCSSLGLGPISVLSRQAFSVHLIKETALLSSNTKPSLLPSFFLSHLYCLSPCLPFSSLRGTCSIRGEMPCSLVSMHSQQHCAGSKQLLTNFLNNKKKKIYAGFQTISLFPQRKKKGGGHLEIYTLLYWVIYCVFKQRSEDNLREIRSSPGHVGPRAGTQIRLCFYPWNNLKKKKKKL